MSSIGVALRFCLRTNATPEPTLTTSAAAIGHDGPSCAPVLMAQTSGAIVVSESSTLIGSIGPGLGSHDSGTSRGANTSSGSRIGTATTKTAPQWKCCSNAPPTIGPSAEPAVKKEAQIAMARRRSEASTKMLRSSDSVDGISMAPNTPSTARAATRYPALGANAAATDTTMKPLAPIISMRRRPIRSPRLPIITSSAASTNEYTSMIHNWVDAAGVNSSAMLGSANARMVLSTAMSSTGSSSTASASHARRGVRTVGSTSNRADMVTPDAVKRMKVVGSWLVWIDGAFDEAGHDGVHDLDSRSAAPLHGLVAGVQ